VPVKGCTLPYFYKCFDWRSLSSFYYKNLRAIILMTQPSTHIRVSAMFFCHFYTRFCFGFLLLHGCGRDLIVRWHWWDLGVDNNQYYALLKRLGAAE